MDSVENKTLPNDSRFPPLKDRAVIILINVRRNTRHIKISSEKSSQIIKVARAQIIS
jgi:hypothetical protein